MKRIREDQQTSRRSNNYRLPLAKGPNSLEGHSRKSSSTHSQQVTVWFLEEIMYFNHNLYGFYCAIKATLN